MLIRFLDHGRGGGAQAAAYLLAEHDHLGEMRAEVRVLRGNPVLVGELIDSLATKHRYTSGVIAWAPSDAPTDAEIHAVLDDFERVAFPGLRSDQYTYVAALALFAAVVGIARTHQPLGWLAGVG